MNSKNIVCLDVETTGLSDKEDYIIQLAAIKFDRITFNVIDKRNWFIKPCRKYTINPDAFAAHGISQEWLDENGDDLREVAPVFLEFIAGCDYLTYNGNSFDVKFIAKDLAMVGFEFPIEGHKFYDAYEIECNKNPRTLSAIYNKYTHNILEGVHDAFNDVNATIEVFKHQMAETDTDYDSLDEWSSSNLLTLDGTIRKTNQFGKEDIVFNIGKHKDEEFCKVYREDFGYIKWYLDNLASNYTKKILKEYYLKNK